MMDKDLILPILSFVWLVAFAYLCCTEFKSCKKDFFRKREEHEDKVTHYITRTKREHTLRNEIRAILYALRVCSLCSLGISIIIGGGICWIVSFFNPKSESHTKEEIEDYEDADFFDDAHRPDRF